MSVPETPTVEEVLDINRRLLIILRNRGAECWRDMPLDQRPAVFTTLRFDIRDKPREVAYTHEMEALVMAQLIEGGPETPGNTATAPPGGDAPREPGVATTGDAGSKASVAPGGNGPANPAPRPPSLLR